MNYLTARNLARPLSSLTKGLPFSLDPVLLSEIGAKRWNVLREDLPLPAAILRTSALEQNSKAMREFLGSTSALLCPHGKTTMSPQVFQLQIDQGAWGITVATVQQFLVARCCGIQRIHMANQLIGRSAIGCVLKELQADPQLDFYCLVDSVEGVTRLQDEICAQGFNRPLQVLLEVGHRGLRCGCRTKEAALQIARSIKKSNSMLALRGVEGFEGLFPWPAREDCNPVEFLEFMAEIVWILKEADLFAEGEILLSAGGSKYFDLVTQVFGAAGLPEATQIILRNGCYQVHDPGHYSVGQTERQRRMQAAGPKLLKAQAALEIWTYVQSVPERSLAILTAGKRDCGHDVGLPVPLKWFRPGLHDRPIPLGPEFVVEALSDHHAHMRIPFLQNLEVGDLVCLGISHPCTTFDKWKILFLVDDDYNITSAIETFF